MFVFNIIINNDNWYNWIILNHVHSRSLFMFELFDWPFLVCFTHPLLIPPPHNSTPHPHPQSSRAPSVDSAIRFGDAAIDFFLTRCRVGNPDSTGISRCIWRLGGGSFGGICGYSADGRPPHSAPPDIFRIRRFLLRWRFETFSLSLPPGCDRGRDVIVAPFVPNLV